MTELDGTEDQKRQDLIQALDERGIDGAERFVWELGDDANLDAALAAIAEADRQGLVERRLLAYRVKQASKTGYRPPSERQSSPASTTGISPTLLRAIRGTCNSPNGITREEATGVFAHKAARMETTADALIDAAMGADWQSTPPHPALDPENPNKAAEYARWVGS